MGGRWYRRHGAELPVGVEADGRPARQAHPALMVFDDQRLVERWVAAGVEVRVNDEVPGAVRCQVDDPVGNRLELLDARPSR